MEKKKLNNEGFSLIELIIVIAIMAILVGALAPQLIKYIERSRESSDVQALGTIYTALSTAMVDNNVTKDKPTIPASGESSALKLSDYCSSSAAGNSFKKSVADTIGSDLSSIVFKSDKAGKDASGNNNKADAVTFKVSSSGDITVTISSLSVNKNGKVEDSVEPGE